ncbi:hypothetical protein QFC24_003938 [Naganishia onofrii]|uniref:Uncharacterized protein n=1 Tax=Naganishia onofrii TaxID=1851511 RepID=A0ACC2XH14_9TREE|nr:hypothetical protein QFC24_003938 [Naganishia onofrii]
MYVRSIFPLLAVFFATCLSLVSCDELNIGFQASINVSQIQITNNDDRQYSGLNTTSFENATNAFNITSVRQSASYSTFIVPVTISRVAPSDIQSLTLRLLTRLYEYDEDEGQQELEVYQERVDLDGQDTYDVITAFNISTEYLDTIAYNFRAQLDLDDDIGSGFIQTITGAAVLSYNSTYGIWTTAEPAVFGQQENEVIHAEYETELTLSSEPPIDTTLETIITDQDPDLPEDASDETIVNPPKEDSNVTMPSPPIDKHKPTPKPDEDHCKHPRSWKRNNDDSWKEAPQSTPCPTYTPPPPCPSGLKHAPIYARQVTDPVTRLQLTLTYGSLAGPAPEPAPVRQLSVTAFGIINNKVVTAIGKTNNQGFVSFAFPSSGNLIVYRVTVSLDAEKYRVSTSKDGGKTFLFWRRSSSTVSWEVPAGGTSSFSYRFKSKANNDVFRVHDRFLTIWVFAKTNVHAFSAKLPAIFFPGNTGPSLFFPAATIAGAYINIHPDKATATSTHAHEFGHWQHYLIRNTAALDSGSQSVGHGFCQPGITSKTLTLKEGYATAFGLTALWKSPFQQGKGTAYCFFPTSPKCVEIENYDCDKIPLADRDGSLDEGRVAAILRDLIDVAGDDSAGDDGRGVSGFSDAAYISRRAVLYDPIRKNPKSMEEYWENFKALPFLNQAQIEAARDVFQYQYIQVEV